MSRIQKMVESRLNELAIKEMEKPEEILEPEMITYSVRLPLEVYNNLDIIAEHLEIKKSDATRELLYQATREALVSLKVDPLEWAESNLVEKGESNE